MLASTVVADGFKSGGVATAWATRLALSPQDDQLMSQDTRTIGCNQWV